MTELENAERVPAAPPTTRLDRLFSQEVSLPIEDRVRAGRGLADLLEESLGNGLSWRQTMKEECHDQELLFQAYARSIVELEHVRQETIHFLEQVGKTNREFRSQGPVSIDARIRILQTETERINQLISWPLQPADKVFNVHLTNVAVDKIIALLGQELKSRTSNTVRRFLELCVQLVGKEILGLIEWANPNACELFFFKRVIIQREEGKDIQHGQQKLEEIQGGLKIVTSRTEVISGEHEIRQARHEHHLHQAMETPLDDNVPLIPQEFQPLLQAIPGWLRPWMRLVTGVQFRGRILEIEVGKEKWQESRPLSPIEEYRVVMDPVIVLGPFVFSGWDDSHMETENLRVDSEEMEREQLEIVSLNAQTLRRGWGLAILWQVVAFILVGAGAAHGNALLWAGIALAAGGVAFNLALARCEASARGKMPDGAFCLAIVLTSIGGIASLHLLGVGVIRDSFELIVPGAVGLLVALRGCISVARKLLA